MQTVDNSCFNFILRTRCPYWRAFANFLFNAFAHIGVVLRTNYSMRPAIRPCWRAFANKLLHASCRTSHPRAFANKILGTLLVLVPSPCTTTSCCPHLRVRLRTNYSGVFDKFRALGEKFIRHVRLPFHSGYIANSGHSFRRAASPDSSRARCLFESSIGFDPCPRDTAKGRGSNQTKRHVIKASGNDGGSAGCFVCNRTRK